MIKYDGNCRDVHENIGNYMAHSGKRKVVMGMKAFESFGFPSFLINALRDQHIKTPTEIQARVFPSMLKGKDVVGQSQTGSGKTLAYALPIITNIKQDLPAIQAVVSLPTRELAQQIYQVFRTFLSYAENDQLRVKVVTGGTDRKKMIEQLERPPHILIATPGRLKDLSDNQSIDLRHTKTFVIDEADQMLELGFLEVLDPVLGRIPEGLQMAVFSATIPEKLEPFLRKYLDNPRFVQVNKKKTVNESIVHYIIPLKYRDRTELTVRLAQHIRPYLALIFTNTKEEADEVVTQLLAAGLEADVLHGGLPPRRRKQVMRKLEKLQLQYLVATDLAARGMDIPGVTHVINHSLPTHLEYYIHRVGRTARAGETGEAYTLVEKTEYDKLQKLEKKGTTFQFLDWKDGELMSMKHPLKKRNFSIKNKKRKRI
ncbi:DEAD/DEAH box helicase [Aliibacillus thermotolerans]|nr:DEAD/DEAH box helicase [Aliibacillus thermotolerans]